MKRAGLISWPRLRRGRGWSEAGEACRDAGGEESVGETENLPRDSVSVEHEFSRSLGLKRVQGFSIFLLAFLRLPPAVLLLSSGRNSASASIAGGSASEPSPAELASLSEACGEVSRADARAFLLRRRLLPRLGGKGTSAGPLVRTRGR